MADLTLDSKTYKSFAELVEANEYLNADTGLYSIWAGQDDDGKTRALISSTRYMVELNWKDGVPDYASPPDEVRDVCALLAGMVVEDPDLLNGAAPGSNVRRAKAGSAEVEFFSPSGARVLPQRLSKLLGELLINGGQARHAIPYDSGANADQCADDKEFGVHYP